MGERLNFETPEGATPIDADGLIPLAIATYGDLCAVEAENILAAEGRYLTRRKNQDAVWLNEPFLRELHKDMFGDVWDWAGTYRQAMLNIGVQPYMIPEEIGRLLGDFRLWHSLPTAEMSILERAARLHHRLVWIHPFRNGNGRHARMAADVYLYSQRQPLPDWPGDELAVTNETRRRYIAALKTADAGDYEPLIALIAELTRA